MRNIEINVLEFVAKYLRKSFDEIHLDSKFIEDLGLDSVDGVQLILAAEHYFGIIISPEESLLLKTPRDAAAFIGSKL